MRQSAKQTKHKNKAITCTVKIYENRLGKDTTVWRTEAEGCFGIGVSGRGREDIVLFVSARSRAVDRTYKVSNIIMIVCSKECLLIYMYDCIALIIKMKEFHTTSTSTPFLPMRFAQSLNQTIG